MGQINQSRSVVIRVCIVLFCIFFSSCKSSRHKNVNSVSNNIVYTVFDSLEAILYNDIVHHPDNDSLCIRIEPRGNFTFAEDPETIGRHIYLIGIYYRHDQDSIFHLSNRKLQICNRLYPVYFTRIDDIFCIPKKKKNVTSSIRGERWDLYSTGYVEVDMLQHKVLFSRMSDYSVTDSLRHYIPPKCK